jgi:dihydroneopterin aldolase
MKRFECVESTIDINTLHYDVRVWVGEDQELADMLNYKDYLDNLVSFIKEKAEEVASASEFVVSITDTFSKVNAVQIRLNKETSLAEGYTRGIMVYTVPF